MIQPEAGRRKKMLLADMDSTMIGQECIDELAAEAGVGERVAAITARAMNGELDFEAALKERVGLLQGLPEAVIDKVLESRITFMPGGKELVSTMRAAGAYAALVSGGFTAFTGRVAASLGFNENRANTLLAEAGVMGIITAPTQERANEIGKLLNPFLLHHPLTREEEQPTFAFPFSPAEIDRGAIYEFCLNHVMELDNPMDAFSLEVRDA